MFVIFDFMQKLLFSWIFWLIVILFILMIKLENTMEKIEIETYKNTIDLNKINEGQADYDDVISSFSRELSADEISLISGASKTGTIYTGTFYV